ncbi:retrotransposon protein, putative, ty1-copia subclass, partial [Tanacetum coccineum]
PKKAEILVVLAIREGKIQKDKRKPRGAKGEDKGKNKLAYAPKPKIPPPPKRDNLEKDSICHHYKEVIIGGGNGLRRSKKLKHGALSLYMDNGMRTAVEAIGSFDLILLSDGAQDFYTSSGKSKDILGLIHTDVCGPFRTVSREGASYFITFKDDFSRYGYVYLMKHKHEVFETFKVFQNEVENQLGKKIKVIRSNRGGEYLSHEFVNHMKSCGIVSELTPPYTPQHNGVSERRNRTLLDMVRSMMNLTTLLKSFWGYALESAARIPNIVSTKKVERTPYEIWHGKAPKLSYLRVWGCEALVKQDRPDKLDPRSIKCIFVGYPKETMGYNFYYPSKNKIFVARNAEFFEDNLIVQETSGSHGPLIMSGSAKGLELIQEEDTQPYENTSEEHNEVVPMELEPQNVKVPIRRYAKIPQALDRYGFYVDDDEYELGDLNEPPNYKAALSDPE